MVEIERELCARSLIDYIKCSWHVVEPGTPFVDGFHIGAICEHLEAVTSGQIMRLVINIPPRHMKSLAVAVFWPTWVWTTQPWFKWMFASYGFHLVLRDSTKARTLISSNWYQERWGHRYHVLRTQDTQERYTNNQGGHRIAASPSGKGTGDGGDAIVADDPHNVLEGESDPVREGTNTWWREVMPTRLNDLKTGRRVIVMQRVHHRDLSGIALAEMGYEHLCLPAEYEPSRVLPQKLDKSPNPDYTPPTSLGFSDPRKEEGQLLWPDKNGPKEIEDLKKDMGPYAVAGQLQQRPVPRGGGLFKRDWFRVIDELPADAEILMRVRAWDLAGSDPDKQKTANDPDWTVGELWWKDQKARLYLADVRRVRKSPGEIEELVYATAELDGKGVTIWIEQDPGQSGKFQVEHYGRMLMDWTVNPVDPTKKGKGATGAPTGSKVKRAEPLASYAEKGMVYLLRGSWNLTFLDEVERFPKGSHDDQIDPASLAFQKLTSTQLSTAELMRRRGYYGR